MRIVASILIAIVLVALVIVAWGALLPKKHHVEDSVIVKASPTDIWGAISDVKDSPSWRSDVTRVEVLDEANPPEHWREMSKNQTITYRLDKSQPTMLRVVSIDDAKLPFDGTWTITVEPFETNITHVRIVEEGDVKNPIYRWVARYVIGPRESIDRYLFDLQKHFQGQAKS